MPSMKLILKIKTKDPQIIAVTIMTEDIRLLIYIRDKAATMSNYVLFALNKSGEKIGYGLVPAAAYQCILNVLNNGFKTSINNSIRRHTSSLIGNALNATFSIINHSQNTTAIVVNT
jgi:hypothetical protein